MTTRETLRILAIGAAVAAALPTGARAAVPAIATHTCSADGLAQGECGNTQAIPDCEVTCFGAASCTDAQCDTIYVEGPLGPTGEVVTQFYLGPVCACLGGWQRIDVQSITCLAELFRRTDLHRSKTAKVLSKCELGVLNGRVTLASGQTCAENDSRTAASIAAYRSQAAQSIASKCPADVMAELYGTDGAESTATVVNGLLRAAEANAAAGIGLALRTAVVAP